MSYIDSFLADNAQYVAKSELPVVESAAFVAEDRTPNDSKPSFAVVTCMDRRLDPIRALGLEGKAAIIRNAGGVAADALRSLIVFQSLTRGKEIAIMHHTDCGLLRVAPTDVRATHKVPPGMEFHEFGDVEQSVRRDVRWLTERAREGALLEGTRIVGWLYETETGKIRPVE